MPTPSTLIDYVIYEWSLKEFDSNMLQVGCKFSFRFQFIQWPCHVSKLTSFKILEQIDTLSLILPFPISGCHVIICNSCQRHKSLKIDEFESPLLRFYSFRRTCWTSTDKAIAVGFLEISREISPQNREFLDSRELKKVEKYECTSYSALAYKGCTWKGAALE